MDDKQLLSALVGFVKDKADFDLTQEPFLFATAQEASENFANSTYNGEPFYKHYKNDLELEIYKKWVSISSVLLEQFKDPNQKVNFNYKSINMNKLDCLGLLEKLQHISQLI